MYSAVNMQKKHFFVFRFQFNHRRNNIKICLKMLSNINLVFVDAQPLEIFAVANKVSNLPYTSIQLKIDCEQNNFHG